MYSIILDENVSQQKWMKKQTAWQQLSDRELYICPVIIQIHAQQYMNYMDLDTEPYGAVCLVFFDFVKTISFHIALTMRVTYDTTV